MLPLERVDVDPIGFVAMLVTAEGKDGVALQTTCKFGAHGGIVVSLAAFLELENTLLLPLFEVVMLVVPTTAEDGVVAGAAVSIEAVPGVPVCMGVGPVRAGGAC